MINTLRRRGRSRWDSPLLPLCHPFCLPLTATGEAEGTAPQRGACLAVKCHKKQPLGWDGVRNLVNPLSVHIGDRGGESSHCEPSQRGSVHPCLEAPNLLITVCHPQEEEIWGFWAQQGNVKAMCHHLTSLLASALCFHCSTLGILNCNNQSNIHYPGVDAGLWRLAAWSCVSEWGPQPTALQVHGGCVSWMPYLGAWWQVSIFTICFCSAQVWKNHFDGWWCPQRALPSILCAPQKYQEGIMENKTLNQKDAGQWSWQGAVIRVGG